MKSPAFARATDSPPNFADAGEDVGDRLLLPVMMYPGSRPRLHFEQATPDRGLNAECGCNGSATVGARGLRRRPIEFGRTDDVDGGRIAHGVSGPSLNR
jgi:hypothetical protein